MKKALLLMLPLLFLFAGCSDSDDNENLKNHPIIGTWALSDYRASVESSNSELDFYLGVFLLDEYAKDNSFLLGSTVTFNENGKATFRSYEGETYGGTFSISKSILTLKVNKEKGSLQFEIYEDKLHFYSDELAACKIEAIRKGYNYPIYKAEFIETFTRID